MCKITIKQKYIFSKQSRGVTLIEVLVVVAIVMILLVPTYDMLFTNSKLITRTTQTVNAKDVSLCIQKIIEQEVLLAKEVEISDQVPSTLGTNEYAIYFKNGELIRKEASGVEKVIGSRQVLENHEVKLIYGGQGTKNLDIHIEVSKTGGGGYKEKVKFNLINVSKINQEGTGTLEYIKYSLPNKISGPPPN